MSGFLPWWQLARHRTLTGGIDSPPDVGVQALRAFDFWDAIGVNTHVLSSGANNAYNDDAAVIEFLQRLNIRHIREGTLVRSAVSVASANALGAAGVMLQLIISKPASARPTMWPISVLDYWFANGLNISYVSGWEGANEQDLPGHNNLPANGWTEAQWAEATLAHQTELFNTAHAGRSAAWRAVPVVGWSMGHAYAAGVGSRMRAASTVADWDALADISCMHNYEPENMSSGIDPSLTNIRTWIYDNPAHPMYVTETGYHTLLTATGHFGTPEDVAAWYTVKSPFAWVKAGTHRIFFYELLDEFPDIVGATAQAYFGLCRYKAPGDAGLFVSKPHGLALANLLGIYKDPAGASFTAGKLDYTITASAPNLDVALHQRSTDNAFLMALYRDVKLYNRTSSVSPFGTYLTVADVDVTIDLGRVFATVEHQRPSAVTGAGGGPTLISTATNVSVVTVPVGKHLSVLILKAAGQSVTLSAVGPTAQNAGTSSVAPAWPAGITAGDIAFLYVGNKPDTVTPSTPAGWTLVVTGTGGTGVQGAGTGLTRVTVFRKDCAGGETGTVPVTITGADVAQGGIFVVHSSGVGSTWNVLSGGVGSDITSATTFAAQAATPMDFLAGDWLFTVPIVSAAVAQTHASHGTLSGLTVTGVAKIAGNTTANGNDLSTSSFRVELASAGTATPTHNVTLAAASYGAAAFVRIRAVPAP